MSTGEVTPLHQHSTSSARRTDAGNARRLVARHGESFRYVHVWKTYLVWDGQRLKPDQSGEMRRLAKSIAQDLFEEAITFEGEQKDKRLKHAARSESLSGIRNMIELAADEPGVPVTPAELDADAYLFNARNGTVDIRTGETRPHAPENLITKVSPGAYLPGQAKCPMWLAFLDRVLDSDAELVEFVRRAIGYTLTGLTTEQILLLLHGEGQNGKTTMLETIRYVAGDYASQVPADTLMASQRGGGIPNDLARLPGARFVSAVETDEGRRLAEGLVKRITGSDTITARFLNAEFFDFKPQFTLWLAANHLPSIRGTDDAIWRRIRLIPFNVQIPAEERDPHLEDKLQAEVDGILTWAIDGARAWHADGLTQPAAVVRAGTSYRAEQDTLGDFITERCHLSESAWIGVGELYDAWKDWAEAGRENPRTKKWMTQQLERRGIDHSQLTTGNRARIYIGIGLLTDERNSSEQDPPGSPIRAHVERDQ